METKFTSIPHLPPTDSAQSVAAETGDALHITLDYWTLSSKLLFCQQAPRCCHHSISLLGQQHNGSHCFLSSWSHLCDLPSENLAKLAGVICKYPTIALFGGTLLTFFWFYNWAAYLALTILFLKKVARLLYPTLPTT